MAGVPQTFRDLIARLPNHFTLAELRGSAGGLQHSSVKVYLSQLVTLGELTRMSPGTFEKPEKPPDVPVEDSRLRPIVERLARQLLPDALRGIVAWNDQALAPFSHDAIMDPFVVLEVRPANIDTVTQILSSDWAVHHVKWRTRLGTMLWDRPRSVRDRPDVFLVTNTSLDGTRPAPGGIRSPTLERLFSDALSFKPLFPETPLQILDARGFDVHDALRLAGRRGNTGLVASFLTWAALQPGHRKHLDELQIEFPHLAIETGA